MHSVQVKKGQQFLPLLDHHHLWLEVAVHEVLLESSRTMSYLQTLRHRTLHLLQHTEEGHHIFAPPPPTLSNPLVWGTHMLWISAMCALRYYAATVILHSVKLNRVFFLSLKVAPSPVVRRLYATYPHLTQMNPCVHNIALVLSRLASIPILRNIPTTTTSASCTTS